MQAQLRFSETSNKVARIVAGASEVVLAGLFAGYLYRGREKVLVQSGLRGVIDGIRGVLRR